MRPTLPWERGLVLQRKAAGAAANRLVMFSFRSLDYTKRKALSSKFVAQTLNLTPFGLIKALRFIQIESIRLTMRPVPITHGEDVPGFRLPEVEG